MTASYLRLVALDAVLFAAGLGALYGLGLVRRRRDALRYAGLACFVGWALVGVAASMALVLGAPLTAWLVLALAAALATAGFLLGRRVPALSTRVVGEPGRASWLAVAGAAIVLVQLAALLRVALRATAPTEWDAWAFWLPKAKSLIEFGGLDTGVGGFTSFAHPSYPPLVPVLEASAFAFTGDTSAAPLAVQHWIVAVAFFGALAALLASRVRPAILWPVLALLASLPTFAALIGSSLGDEPLMLLVAMGGACSALLLLEGNVRYAVLAGLFLGSGALAKDEGLPISLVVAATVLVAALARRPRRPLAAALVVFAPIATVVPWKLWLRLNDVPTSGDYRLSDLLHPALLADRLDRLSYAAKALPPYVLEPGRWLIAVPLMLVAALLAAPRRPALSALAVLAVVAVPVGLLVVYWIGLPPVDWYVTTSAARGVSSAVVLAAVMLPLLLAEASSRDAPPP